MRVELGPANRVARAIVADGDEGFRSLMRLVLDALPAVEVVAEAADGFELLDRTRTLAPDLVVADTRLAGLSGPEVARTLEREAPAVRLLMVTAFDDRDEVVSVVRSGAHGLVLKGDRIEDIQRAVLAVAAGRSVLSDAITRPFLSEFLQLYTQERNRADELERMVLAFTSGLAAAIEKRDKGTGQHSKRVVSLALRILREIDAARAADPVVRYGYLLHDVGKIAVPDAILLKNGPLTMDELTVMRLHPIAGAEILSAIPPLRQAVPIVRHHHERFDGTGYPDGLSGPAIPLECRAFAVADAFDAMTDLTFRDYRRALSMEEAVDAVSRGRGTQFDPEIVDAFLAIVASAG